MASNSLTRYCPALLSCILWEFLTYLTPTFPSKILYSMNLHFMGLFDIFYIKKRTFSNLVAPLEIIPQFHWKCLEFLEKWPNFGIMSYDDGNCLFQVAENDNFCFHHELCVRCAASSPPRVKVSYFMI